MKIKNVLYISLFLLVSCAICTQTYGQESSKKHRVNTIGIAKPIGTDGNVLTNDCDCDDSSPWGISLGTINYRVRQEGPFNLGWYYGSVFDIVFPPKMDFTPINDSFLSPQLVWDVLQLGVAGRITILDEMQLYANAGIAPTASFGIFAYDTPGASAFSFMFGIGLTPHLGARLFLNDNFSIGISQRLGKINSKSYTKIGDSDIVKSPSMKAGVSTFYVSLSF